MRFLLSVPSLSGSRVPIRGKNTNNIIQHATPPVNQSCETMKTWGQQCSPNCGCVIRFEASIDTTYKNQIKEVKYVAKRILTRNSLNKDNSTLKLQPIKTYGREKVLVKDCDCKTLHSLSQTIVKNISRLTLDQAQNQLEYEGTRSSDAFRFTALKKLNLLKNKDLDGINGIPEGKCYDLVEDAITACLQGYIPKQRKVTPSSFPKPLRIRSPIEREKEFIEERGLDPLRYANAAKQRASQIFESFKDSSNIPSQSSMPPFHLLHEEDAQMNTLTQIRNDIMSSNEKERSLHETKAVDWVSYIDERDAHT